MVTPNPLQGLTTAQAEARRMQFGPNQLQHRRRAAWLNSMVDIVTEPMFILLAVACGLYFFLGELSEAMMMMVSIFFVAGIELYQETKSARALEALRQYTQAQVRVRRDGQWVSLPTEDLVPDDVVAIAEGEHVPADGVLLEVHDLTVDESVLTGESLPVVKGLSDMESASDVGALYQGTTLASGQGVLRVTQTGNNTALGKLGRSIEAVDTPPTPLQRQIRRFVTQMGVVGGLAFLVVFALNWLVEQNVWKALLFSLTLAMAILPEEIPVAFSAFMALGAYRMIRHGILAKQPSTVESLGSATVICLDKTGTITQNRMQVAEVVDLSGRGLVLAYAQWASEPEPFDAMEKALFVGETGEVIPDPRAHYQLVHEYPLGGQPPMMTHVWAKGKGEAVLVAAKGAVERIVAVCALSAAEKAKVLEKTHALAAKGYRVLGVANAKWTLETYPNAQDDFPWEMEGLVAFYDPPKTETAAVFQKFYEAGIRVVMITGDHAATAQNIATQTGLRNNQLPLTGAAVMAMDDDTLRTAVRHTNVFARMFPEAKLRVVETLKANGETVAMSGDGVNDGPALKSAQIGVAMGERGTEIAKGAASLVLLKDDLGAMVTALQMGRRIYDNLRKAIRYIISIHLPIVLVVLLPLSLGWPYTHILLPLHVIFLELVMDPTAAISFENEPAEPGLMHRRPRATNSLFTGAELLFSLLQGAVIAAVVLGMYQWALQMGKVETGVRTVVFATLVFGNLFLTLTNRSFTMPMHRTLRYRNSRMPLILGVSVAMLLALLYVPALANLFRMEALSAPELGLCFLAGFASVGWFEVYKLFRGNVTE